MDYSFDWIKRLMSPQTAEAAEPGQVELNAKAPASGAGMQLVPPKASPQPQPQLQPTAAPGKPAGAAAPKKASSSPGKSSTQTKRPQDKITQSTKEKKESEQKVEDTQTVLASPFLEEVRSLMLPTLQQNPQDAYQKSSWDTFGSEIAKNADVNEAHNLYGKELDAVQNRKVWDTIIGALGQAVAGGIGLATKTDVAKNYKYTPSVDEEAETKRAQYGYEQAVKAAGERRRDAMESLTNAQQEAKARETPLATFADAMSKLGGQTQQKVTTTKGTQTGDQNLEREQPSRPERAGGGRTPTPVQRSPDQVARDFAKISPVISALSDQIRSMVRDETTLRRAFSRSGAPGAEAWVNYFKAQRQALLAANPKADPDKISKAAIEMTADKMVSMWTPPGTNTPANSPEYEDYRKRVAEFEQQYRGSTGIPIVPIGYK